MQFFVLQQLNETLKGIDFGVIYNIQSNTKGNYGLGSGTGSQFSKSVSVKWTTITHINTILSQPVLELYCEALNTFFRLH